MSRRRVKSTSARRCAGKIAHATREAALRHIADSVTRLGVAAGRLEPYACGLHFHVGHRPRGKR